MATQLSVTQAQAVLDASGFGPWWGFQVLSVEAGVARLSLKSRPELLRPGGVLQGGCAMTLADVTCWIAVMSLSGTDDPSVTQQMTTTFLRPARTDLTCVSTVLKPGRRISYAEASVMDTDGKLITHHTLSYLRP